MSGGEKLDTMNSDWKTANKEYMKFQNMNPIFGKTSWWSHLNFNFFPYIYLIDHCWC
jgi:hypothetical protein